MFVQNMNLIHQWQGGLYSHEKNEHDNMFGYCGVTDDKIHFGVSVSKKQNMFSLRGGGSVTETWRARLRKVFRLWNNKNLENQHLRYQHMHANSHQGLSQGHNLILQRFNCNTRNKL